DTQAGNDLTRERCVRFNEEVPDSPNVKYLSVSAAMPFSEVSLLLMQPHQVISKEEGPNDGIVSVWSSRWGEHLGTWRVDHLHSVNKRLALRDTVGDISPRYLDIAEDLCRRGLCARDEAS